MTTLDITVAAFLWASDEVLSYEKMAEYLDVSKSTVYLSTKKSVKFGLLNDSVQPKLHALNEILVYSVKYLAPASPGGEVRGVETGVQLLPSKDHLLPPSRWVWPYAFGKHRGQSIEPIHKGVPKIALDYPKFWQLMAATDLVRCGHAREKNAGIDAISQLLQQ